MLVFFVSISSNYVPEYFDAQILCSIDWDVVAYIRTDSGKFWVYWLVCFNRKKSWDIVITALSVLAAVTSSVCKNLKVVTEAKICG